MELRRSALCICFSCVILWLEQNGSIFYSKCFFCLCHQLAAEGGLFWACSFILLCTDILNRCIHPSEVSKWVPASAGKAKAGMVHSVSGCTRDLQVKLWDPLRTRAITERLRGVFMMRRYTNTHLPLPLYICGQRRTDQCCPLPDPDPGIFLKDSLQHCELGIFPHFGLYFRREWSHFHENFITYISVDKESPC